MLTRELGATGLELPVIGQGTWTIGDKPARAKAELRELCVGIDLGLTP